MEYPNSVVSSGSTDYGTTSLDNTNAAAEYADETANDFAYQSLPPYAKPRKLFAKPTHSRPSQDSPSFVTLSSRLRFPKMSMDKSAHNETRVRLERLEIALNVLNQICIGFVTIYMSWVTLRTGLAGTGLHAWLVTIGFSFLMAEAIMCHYSINVLTFNYKRSTKTTIHWIMQVLGGGCGLAGALIKLIQKGFSLHSIHGKLGFSAFIICLVSMLSGLTALFSARLKKTCNPLLNKSLHNFLGIAAFVVALAAQYYGYQTGYFSRKVSTDFQRLMEYVTLLSLVLTCIGPLKSLYYKICNIIRHFG